MARNKKRDLINETYELLTIMEIKDITIRGIASAAGCSSALIYKHFSDVDELIRVASVRFLDEYRRSLQDSVEDLDDPLAVEVAMWESFVKYAFRYIDVFELIFWNHDKEQMRGAIRTYYEIFPEKQEEIGGRYADLYTSIDLKERNRMILLRAVDAGYFSTEDVSVLVSIQIETLHGMMATYRDSYQISGIPDRAAKNFMFILHSLHEHYRLK